MMHIEEVSKASVMQSIKSANFVWQIYWPTKICHVTYRIHQFFQSVDFIVQDRTHTISNDKGGRFFMHAEL